MPSIKPSELMPSIKPSERMPAASLATPEMSPPGLALRHVPTRSHRPSLISLPDLPPAPTSLS
eukprot:4103810-Prymnesium_polylepis.1